MRAEVLITVFLRPGLTIGPDAIGLLVAVVETGSIAAAARARGISYKKAWHMVERLNTSFKEPLVNTTRGGEHRGGSTLTDTGRTVISLYRAIVDAAGSRSEELQRLAALAA